MTLLSGSTRATRRDLLKGAGALTLGIASISLLAACGGGAAPAPTSAAATPAPQGATGAAPAATPTPQPQAAAATPAAQGNPPSGKKGEVSWLVRTGPVENKWEKEVAIPAFQKANPDIKINLIIVPWDQFDPKLFTLFAGGTPVDVWSHWGRSGFADYVHKGMVADLTPHINSSNYDLSGFAPGVVDIYKVNGKYMGMPLLTTFGTPLFYNANLFQQANIDPPPVDWKSPWSWEQFVEAGKKLTKDYGTPTGTYGISYTQNIQQLAYLGGGDAFLPEHYQTGLAKTTKLDSPEVLAGVEAVYNLIYKDKVSPTPQLSSALSSGNVDPFRAQKLAITVDGGWQYWNYKPQIHDFKWAVGADPKLQTNKNVTYTDPWMLSSKSADPESAWKFIAYLVSEEGQTAYITATGTPPTRTKLIDKWLDDFTGPTGMSKEQLQKVTSGALENGVESVNHLFVGYDEISKAIDQVMGDVWAGKKTPKEGLAAAKAQVDVVLASIK
ncbi:MAG: extracellular solute-binding protein [Chloroflexi bacterium]|nr:extracellular solute-binding protein [Chloroflexota bacterium]